MDARQEMDRDARPWMRGGRERSPRREQVNPWMDSERDRSPRRRGFEQEEPRRRFDGDRDGGFLDPWKKLQREQEEKEKELERLRRDVEELRKEREVYKNVAEKE